MNSELKEIEDYNRKFDRRYLSVCGAILVIWAAFLWWLFGY
jgi:hypothetical protein